MNNIIDTVWSLANEFVDSAKLVTINSEKVTETAANIAEWKKGGVRVFQGYPLCIRSGGIGKTFLYELIANSVNYCFWYGRHDIRPNEASSTKMYSLLDESFDYLEELKKTSKYDNQQEK